MANSHRGDFAIELDGKQFTLRFTLNALAALEGDLKCSNMTKMLSVFTEDLGFVQIRALLFRGLQFHHPELKEHDVGNFDFEMSVITRQLMEAMVLGVSGKVQAAPAGSGDDPQPQAGVGTGVTT